MAEEYEAPTFTDLGTDPGEAITKAFEEAFHLMVIRPEDDARRYVQVPGVDWPTVAESQEAIVLSRVKAEIGGNIDIGSARPMQYAVGEFSLVDGVSQPNPFASRMMGRDIRGTLVMWGVSGGGGSQCAKFTWEDR